MSIVRNLKRIVKPRNSKRRISVNKDIREDIYE
jgi:hypothetical protein